MILRNTPINKKIYIVNDKAQLLLITVHNQFETHNYFIKIIFPVRRMLRTRFQMEDIAYFGSISIVLAYTVPNN